MVTTEKQKSIQTQSPDYLVGTAYCDIFSSEVEIISSTYHGDVKELIDIKESVIQVNDPSLPKWRKQTPNRYVIEWELDEVVNGWFNMQYHETVSMPVVKSVRKF